ncbi:SEC-C motif-containing protein [Blastococcus sp. DSM 46786]|uniref:SEC-C domain-containing protein n=1 Tax=Blastococcus sp. DSM 46786 TaxID=1798227 RepID=UPI0008D5640B|nr:SEC-C domain-containing protein [Blastococcus sp. DSM 46786]SEK60218.1 SEC-C motif-containing protein [Blastococcus sp. DSM 46786]
MPTGEEIEQHVVAVVRERQPVGTDDVDRLVIEQLGATPDDPLVEQLLDRVIDGLLRDDESPIAMLAPDLLVHVPALLDGVVLTHRLTDDERESGVLLAVDLPGFARTGLQHHGEAIHDCVGDDGLPRWLGPRDWLTSFPAGSLLTVRAQADGEIALAALSSEPTAADELVGTVRAAYDTEVEEPWLPVPAEDLLLATLVRDRGAFAQPAPPLTELAVAAGLELRGASFAHEESVWRQAAIADRHYRIIHRLGAGPEVSAAGRALELLDEGIPDRTAAHEVLRNLYSLPVLEVVVDELLGTSDDADRAARLAVHADRLLALTSRPAEQAVAHWLAAAAAERLGAAQDAETQLRAAVRADPGWPAAEDRLAWYESDRGNAVAAVARLRRLGFSRQDSPDLAVLERFAEAPVERSLGRNEPCWCGSGRKYKVCHLNRPEQPSLPDRVGWLYRKAVAYLERRGGEVRSVVSEHALALVSADADADAIDDALEDPLVSDTVLHEGGWWPRFLDDRGPLLPDDEALLAASWALVERTVCEVLDVVPGRGLTVRDLRTGDRLDVRERTFSRTARSGTLVCARIVPDGETHQFVGGLFPVAPGTEAALLELLDQHDGPALLEYVADLRRPPRLITTDGEPLLDCRAEFRVPDPSSARSVLDHRYERDDDGGCRSRRRRRVRPQPLRAPSWPGFACRTTRSPCGRCPPPGSMPAWPTSAPTSLPLGWSSTSVARSSRQRSRAPPPSRPRCPTTSCSSGWTSRSARGAGSPYRRSAAAPRRRRLPTPPAATSCPG